MPNKTMPYDNLQSPAIPNQKQDQNQRLENEGENEGEGSRSAARNYDKATEEYVKSGRVSGAAKEAEAALDGPEGDALREAEKSARNRAPGSEDDEEDRSADGTRDERGGEDEPRPDDEEG